MTDRGGQHLARDVARGVGPGEPARRRRPSRRAVAGSSSDRVDLGAQPLRRQLRRRRSRPPRRRPAIQRAFAVWWSARRVRVRDEHGRQPVLRELEDGAAGARDGEVGRGERAAERDRRSRAGRSGGPGAARSAKSRRPATCSTRYGASANAATAASVDRAGAERAAEDEHAALVRRRCRARRGRARGRRRAAGPGDRSRGSARRRGRGSGTRGRRGGRAARAGGWSGRGASRPR